MPAKLLLLLFIGASLLSGCASSPKFDVENIDMKLMPADVIAQPERSFHKTVLWGGTILDTRNLDKQTQIEILAYPLKSSQRPDQTQTPLGRFIIRQAGYLEPVDFSQGRMLTVSGDVIEVTEGRVGESSYRYPVIRAEQIHLWSEDAGEVRTNFSLGIGIRL